jgi:Ferritin-like domain
MKTVFFTGAFAAIAIAGPGFKRFNIQSEDASTVGASDAAILTYALVLEHLENAFYRGGLQNFTQAQFANAGFDAAFYANLEQVAQDEANHVAFLTAGLTAAGATPPAACVYNFPYADPRSFVALASILEGVGVSGSYKPLYFDSTC